MDVAVSKNVGFVSFRKQNTGTYIAPQFSTVSSCFRGLADSYMEGSGSCHSRVSPVSVVRGFPEKPPPYAKS